MMGMPAAMVWMLALAELAAGVKLIAGAFGKEILTRVGDCNWIKLGFG